MVISTTEEICPIMDVPHEQLLTSCKYLINEGSCVSFLPSISYLSIRFVRYPVLLLDFNIKPIYISTRGIFVENRWLHKYLRLILFIFIYLKSLTTQINCLNWKLFFNQKKHSRILNLYWNQLCQQSLGHLK